MEIFNNTRNVTNRQTKINTKAKTKRSISSSSNAVKVFIDPRIFSSLEYKLILKENNHFPIHNPNVLQYDQSLNLKFYDKI